MIKLIATKIEVRHLKPGELYATLEPKHLMRRFDQDLGVEVYIRTNEAASDIVDDLNEIVWKVEIVSKGASGIEPPAQFDPHLPPGRFRPV